MRIFVPREMQSGESRVALVPDAIQRLVGLGANLSIEAGLGASVSISDEVYQKAGAQISDDRQDTLRSSDVVLRVRKPPLDEIGLLKAGCIHVSLLDPFNEREAVRALAAGGVSAIGLEMLPRITFAQKMDVIVDMNIVGVTFQFISTRTIADDQEMGVAASCFQQLRSPNQVLIALLRPEPADGADQPR